MNISSAAFRLRWVSLALIGLVLGIPPGGPAIAQSAETVVKNMQAAYQKQLDAVDSYIVETDYYTSYHEKIVQDGEPTYRSTTRLKGDTETSFATSGASAYGFNFDELTQHSTYGGTETVDGIETHILHVDTPSEVDSNLDASTDQVTYYIDATRHVPVRAVMQSQRQGTEEPTVVTINMRNYQTVEGLTLPYRIEVQADIGMSEQERQQMEAMMKKLEELPEEIRSQMKEQLGEQMASMNKMLSGEPIVIEVQDVQVNVPIPEGTFSEEN